MRAAFITLGAGCFWCAEATYQQVHGVMSVEVGYANGDRLQRPTYDEVNTDETGYVEVVRVGFDPTLVSLSQILEIFFAIHDPTSLNRQGDYEGTRYRSGIYVDDAGQVTVAEVLIREIQQSAVLGKPIVTEIQVLRNYWKAEDEYQDYFARNPSEAYCSAVIGPKIERFRDTFIALLKR